MSDYRMRLVIERTRSAFSNPRASAFPSETGGNVQTRAATAHKGDTMTDAKRLKLLNARLYESALRGDTPSPSAYAERDTLAASVLTRTPRETRLRWSRQAIAHAREDRIRFGNIGLTHWHLNLAALHRRAL